MTLINDDLHGTLCVEFARLGGNGRSEQSHRVNLASDHALSSPEALRGSRSSVASAAQRDACTSPPAETFVVRDLDTGNGKVRAEVLEHKQSSVIQGEILTAGVARLRVLQNLYRRHVRKPDHALFQVMQRLIHRSAVLEASAHADLRVTDVSRFQPHPLAR